MILCMRKNRRSEVARSSLGCQFLVEMFRCNQQATDRPRVLHVERRDLGESETRRRHAVECSKNVHKRTYAEKRPRQSASAMSIFRNEVEQFEQSQRRPQRRPLLSHQHQVSTSWKSQSSVTVQISARRFSVSHVQIIVNIVS